MTSELSDSPPDSKFSHSLEEKKESVLTAESIEKKKPLKKQTSDVEEKLLEDTNVGFKSFEIIDLLG